MLQVQSLALPLILAQSNEFMLRRPFAFYAGECLPRRLGIHNLGYWVRLGPEIKQITWEYRLPSRKQL